MLLPDLSGSKPSLTIRTRYGLTTYFGDAAPPQKAGFRSPLAPVMFRKQHCNYFNTRHRTMGAWHRRRIRKKRPSVPFSWRAQSLRCMPPAPHDPYLLDDYGSFLVTPNLVNTDPLSTGADEPAESDVVCWLDEYGTMLREPSLMRSPPPSSPLGEPA